MSESLKLYTIAVTAIKNIPSGIRLMGSPGVLFARSDDEALGAALKFCRTKLPDCTNHDAIVSEIPEDILKQALIGALVARAKELENQIEWIENQSEHSAIMDALWHLKRI